MVKNPNIFQIGIKISTKNRLEKLRHSGQSWDGVIDEMLNKLDEIDNKFNPKPSMEDMIKQNTPTGKIDE